MSLTETIENAFRKKNERLFDILQLYGDRVESVEISAEAGNGSALIKSKVKLAPSKLRGEG